MDALAAWYLFWVGVAAGVALLAMTAYAGVSPLWLRGVLLASGAVVMSRYVSMVVYATNPGPPAWEWWSRCWFGTSVGLTLPGVVALDQLVRHPAMTPKKLLTWFSPFLAAYAAVLALGTVALAPDPIIGMRPHLVGWARVVLGLTHTGFVAGFLWVGIFLVRKLPVRRIQVALLGLMAAFVYLGLDGIVESVGWWYFRPFLFSDITALVAIWFALYTAQSSAL